MKMMRCKIEEIVVRTTATGLGERIGEGQVVDFDRVLTPAIKGTKDTPDVPAFTLGDAVAGKHDEWFVPVETPAAAPTPKSSAKAQPAEPTKE